MRKLLLVTLILSALLPSMAWGDSAQIIAHQDGNVRPGVGANYATVKSGAGSVIGSGELRIGQYFTTNYYIHRAFASFADIPAMSEALTCTLFVDGSADASDTDFNIVVYDASASKPLFDATDFVNFDGYSTTTLTGTVLNDLWNSSAYSAGANAIIFNAAGLSALLAATGDTLRIAICSEEDANNSAPIGNEYVRFDASVDTNKPYLSFTYTAPGAVSAPTVTESTHDDTSITIDITGCGSADSVQVYVGGVRYGTITDLADTTGYAITGRTYNTAYAITAKNYEADVASDASNTLNVTTDWAAPDVAPETLDSLSVASANGHFIVTRVSEFAEELIVTNFGDSLATIDPADSLDFTLTLTPATDYNLNIFARNPAADSDTCAVGLVFTTPAAQVYDSWYVDDSATGTDAGTDWTNAWPTVGDIVWGGAGVARGDTVWIADGAYGRMVLNMALDGTLVNIIKKASPTAHGTAIGWDDSLGDGQAVFTPNGGTDAISIETGYWLIDGSYRTDETSGYGFVSDILESDSSAAGIFLDPTTTGGHADHVTIRYWEYDGPGVGLSNASIGFRSSETDYFDHIAIQYCYLHDNSKVMMRIARCDNITIEYCFLADVYSGNPEVSHGGGISSYYGVDYLTIRYSKFRNIEGSSALAAIHSSTGMGGCNHIRIYGNVVWYTPEWGGEQGYYDIGASATVTNNLTAGDGVSDWIIYNNTMINIQGLNSGLEIRDVEVNDNYAYNNLWLSSEDATLAIWTDHDHNIAIDTGQKWNWSLEANELSAGYDSTFVDWTNGDFGLIADAIPVNAGIDVATLLGVEATDMLGNEWGADGYWDVGALEFQGAVSDSIPITPGSFALTDTTGQSASFSWTDESGDIETAFKIRIAGDGDVLGTFAANATSGTIYGLAPESDIWVEIIALNGAIESDQSDSVHVVTRAILPPSGVQTDSTTTDVDINLVNLDEDMSLDAGDVINLYDKTDDALLASYASTDTTITRSYAVGMSDTLYATIIIGGYESGASDDIIVQVEPQVVTSITVSPATASMQVGTSFTPTATVLDQDGNAMEGETVTWSSGDTDIATVDEDTGEITAVTSGLVTITAAVGEVEGTITVAVYEGSVYDGQNGYDSGAYNGQNGYDY